SLLVMLGAVGLVLLVACINLGNLLIVRTLEQQREVAIRLAIGASQAQVALELVVRGVVLGLFGGAAGLLLGVWIRNLLVAMAPVTVPWLDHVGLNLRVFAVTFGLAVVAGTAAALLPAIQVRGGWAAGVLGQGALTTPASRSIARWRGMLTALEIAAAVPLAIGAGLLVRSFVRLTSVPLGFDPTHVLMFAVRPPATRYDAAARA